MSELLLGTLSAFWLGILTSISPCPLATNIAAISYVGRRVASPRQVFLAGLLYTAGRSLVYVALGVVLVSSLMSAPMLSHALQKYMNRALGPILILVGMVLVELIQLRFSGGGISEDMQRRVDRLDLWGALVLGILFALSFCPISAALFFVNLVALAVKTESRILIPSVYGAATGLPVLLFALLLAVGAGWVGKVYNRLGTFELWARRVTGTIFIVVGIYYCLTQIFGLQLRLWSG